MSHTIRHKQKLLNRVLRIQGQVESIVRALESETGCGVVLQRIAAARGAMNGLMSAVVEDYVRYHVLSPEGVKPSEREQVADDFIDVVRAYLK